MKKADIRPNTIYHVSMSAQWVTHPHRTNFRSGYILTGDTIEWMPSYSTVEHAEEMKAKYGEGYQLAYLDPSNFTVVTPDHTAMKFVPLADAEIAVNAVVEASDVYSKDFRAIRDGLRAQFPEAMGNSRITADSQFGRVHVKQVEREIGQDAYWAKAQADADAAAQRVIDRAAQDVAYEHYQKWADAEFVVNVAPVVQDALRRIPHGFMAVCKDSRAGVSLQSKVDESITDGDFETLYTNWGINLTDDNGETGVVFGKRSFGKDEVELGMSFATMLAMAAAWKTVYGDRYPWEVVTEFAPTFDLTRPPAEARA